MAQGQNMERGKKHLKSYNVQKYEKNKIQF